MKKVNYFAFIGLSILCLSSNLSAQSQAKGISSLFDKNETFLIIEAGINNSQVFTTNNASNSFGSTTDTESSFMVARDDWDSMSGFSAAIKFGQSIGTLLDSQISLDFITGIGYKETNVSQQYYNGYNVNTGLLIFDCFGISSIRDINIKSIEIPLELRSNISLKNFNISPTIGMGVDIPVSKKQTLFNYNYSSQELSKGDLRSEDKIDPNQAYSFHAISKLEVSYLLPNQYKLKFAGFFNLNITNELSTQLTAQDGFYSKGLQLGLEIPINALTKNEVN